MKKLSLIVIALMLLGSCNKSEQYDSAEKMVAKAMKNVNMITPDELHWLMENYETYTLIDVRQELEHYHGFIPGSVNIPRGSLEFNISDSIFWDQTGLYKPEKGEKIILYCLKGQRSTLAAESLKKLGYNNAFVLSGGYKNWELTYPEIFEKALDKLSGQSDKPAKSGSC
ncbi:MAG: rhodanese-like domain-containing protein [Bacteroidales bacterium]|nr:rhodanese-like domain-containing protein [Bacteroidales bacterium]MDZ4204985.1 rhodanese-like domain-containing protein [Bacteroidales bacterium]